MSRHQGQEKWQQTGAKISCLVTQRFYLDSFRQLKIPNDPWKVVIRGRLAAGDEQRERGGATDQQTEQGEGHRACTQTLVQVEPRSGEPTKLLTGSFIVSLKFCPGSDTSELVPDSI